MPTLVYCFFAFLQVYQHASGHSSDSSLPILISSFFHYTEQCKFLSPILFHSLTMTHLSRRIPLFFFFPEKFKHPFVRSILKSRRLIIIKSYIHPLLILLFKESKEKSIPGETTTPCQGVLDRERRLLSDFFSPLEADVATANKRGHIFRLIPSQ